MTEDYRIEFVKLKLGKHNLTLEVDKSFFLSFENTEVIDANIKVEMELDRHPNWINVSFSAKGFLSTGCDRCLVNIPFPIDVSYFLVYRMGIDETQEDTEDIKYLKPHDYFIDVSLPVYETILLNLPMIRNCDNLEVEPCDKTMLSKLEENEKNTENQEDSRWEKLKGLK